MIKKPGEVYSKPASHWRFGAAGQKVGHLTLLRPAPRPAHVHSKKLAYWECKCDCGKVIVASRERLNKGKVREVSCGCVQVRNCKELAKANVGTHVPRRRVQIGERFGMLEALERTDQRVRGLAIYRCACDCGKEAMVAGYLLRSGQSQSCGCHKRTVQLQNMAYGIYSQRERRW